MKQSLLERAGLEVKAVAKGPAAAPSASRTRDVSTSWTTARVRSKIRIGPFNGPHRGADGQAFALMADKKKNKIRTAFRKNRTARARSDDWTRQFHSNAESQEDQVLAERISGKGELTRKRTIVGTTTEGEQAGLGVLLDVDARA